MSAWICELCHKAISPLGAYCKRTATAYRHMSCHSEAVFEAGLTEYQKRKAEEATTNAEIEARVKFLALPRCTRCGIKMGDGTGLSHLGEIRATSSVAGVCYSCVQTEVAARSAARSLPTPPPPAPKKEPEAPKDRFTLIDMD